METEYIYCRHHTPIGVKIEEISGAEQRSGAVWRAMAMQVWKENGPDGYRDIYHTQAGAPLVYDSDARISLSHARHLLVVATLPPTPEADLEQYSDRTALGVDAELADRDQVLRVRERYLSERELGLFAADDVKANILAWTCKEALYKAALCPGLDWREDISIEVPPTLGHADGRASVKMRGSEYPFTLYSYECDGYIVSVAIGPHTATYIKDKGVKRG